MDSTGPQGVEASSQKPPANEEPYTADFVAKEKYQKLKRRFQTLREVSPDSIHSSCRCRLNSNNCSGCLKKVWLVWAPRILLADVSLKMSSAKDQQT